MINILLSSYDYAEGALFDRLKSYIKESMRVVVIAFSHYDSMMPTSVEYDKYCGKGGEYFEIIANQFQKFGIKYENIELVHYFKDSIEVMKDKISQADIIFLTGGLPDKTIERLEEKDLIDSIKKFDGIIMGASAGALIQLPEYFCTPDEDYEKFIFCQGLDLVKKNIYVEVHYSDMNLLEEFKELKLKNKTIYAIPDGAGIVYSNSEIQTIGNVKIFNE